MRIKLEITVRVANGGSNGPALSNAPLASIPVPAGARVMVDGCMHSQMPPKRMR